MSLQWFDPAGLGKKKQVQCSLSYTVRAPCGQGLCMSVVRVQMQLWLDMDI